MNTTNRIGLDTAKSAELAAHLQKLLANYSVFYQNVRGYHWNIRGEKFFELHAKFEELYSDLQVKIDEVAERILTLGHAPEHRFSGYLSVSAVQESREVHNGPAAVEEILKALKEILQQQRHILTLADQTGDEGTLALMSDYIRQQEKLVWMYSAYLNKG